MNGVSGHEGGCKVCSVSIHLQQCKRWKNKIVECGNHVLGGLKVVMAWKCGVVYNDKVKYFCFGVQSQFMCFYFGFIEEG
jgi:hypothetical protein